MGEKVQVCLCCAEYFLTDCFIYGGYVLQVNLLFFAKSRELAAVSEAKIELPSTVLTGKQLLEEILSAYPA